MGLCVNVIKEDRLMVEYKRVIIERSRVSKEMDGRSNGGGGGGGQFQ